jgi:hypothetical protein
MVKNYKGENNNMWGKHHSDETKEKISNSLKHTISLLNYHYNKGKKRTEEQCEKYSKAKIGIASPRKGKCYEEIFGKSICDKLKQILREKRINYLKEIGVITGPNIGRYEKPILDHLEVCFTYPIFRQYFINGYFLDGYCPILNLVIEIDEHFHYQNTERDLLREQQIKNALNCRFLRIKVGE